MFSSNRLKSYGLALMGVILLLLTYCVLPALSAGFIIIVVVTAEIVMFFAVCEAKDSYSFMALFLLMGITICTVILMWTHSATMMSINWSIS